VTDTWADIPLTEEILDAVRKTFGVDVTQAPGRLHGGEESASYRVGGDVIRLSPAWREDAELEWCYAIATMASRKVPEAHAPRRTEEGRCVIRVGDRPVTVWPYAQGAWADDENDSHVAQAAQLLARLHGYLRQFSVGPRPVETSPLAPAPDLDDPDLNARTGKILERYPERQPLHGDFYHGNVLVADGKVTALVDWDNAFVGPPELELAWASWEWSDARDAVDPRECAEFISVYRAVGGPAAAVDESTIATVVRSRLRWEIAYGRAMRERGVEVDADYENESVEAFFTLKRFS
jgi:Ser/Thr protein kinase RdoA (MazF antagonist)